MAANNAIRYWRIEEYNELFDNSSNVCPEKTCWEMAREVDDFRSAFHICEDCIVFLLKNGSSLLSEREIRSIGDRKVSCKFFNA